MALKQKARWRTPLAHACFCAPLHWRPATVHARTDQVSESNCGAFSKPCGSPGRNAPFHWGCAQAVESSTPNTSSIFACLRRPVLQACAETCPCPGMCRNISMPRNATQSAQYGVYNASGEDTRSSAPLRRRRLPQHHRRARESSQHRGPRVPRRLARPGPAAPQPPPPALRRRPLHPPRLLRPAAPRSRPPRHCQPRQPGARDPLEQPCRRSPARRGPAAQWRLPRAPRAVAPAWLWRGPLALLWGRRAPGGAAACPAMRPLVPAAQPWRDPASRTHCHNKQRQQMTAEISACS